MKLSQITHHDLDGYGAGTVVAAFAEVRRVTHVSRYSDVGPVVAAELERLTRVKEAERLVMTDLGLEAVAVSFLKNFAAMNAKREPERRHHLVVLDHHASSIDQLTAQHVGLATPLDGWPIVKCFDLGDPQVTVLIDETRCATRLAFDHHELYAGHEPSPEAAAALPVLVEAIDAIDLWQKQRPMFRPAIVLDEVFWENVGDLIPVDHPWHDRFIGSLLLAMAARLGGGATPAAIEREVGGLRTAVVDTLLADQPDDDREQTTRMRLAPILARAPELFRRLSGGAKLSFGLDAGTFQRTSDAILTSGDASLVINVQRSGSMSFRSNDQTALDSARKFRGGGHKDAAGGRLGSVAVTSLADAVAQVEPLLYPPAPDASKSPFAALQGFKA